MKKQLRFLQSGMGCTERIQATYSALSGASKKIADFVIDHPDQAVHMTVVQLAESCEVSEASVVRFCQCLQYAGFYEFKLSLAAEIVPASQMIQEDITVEDTEPTILEKVFAGEQQALQETLQMLNRQDFISAVNHIAFSNKVEFFSCGNARPIAQDAHYRLLRTGIDSRIGIDDYDCLIHASMLRTGDVAIGISHSGSTKNTAPQPFASPVWRKRPLPGCRISVWFLIPRRRCSAVWLWLPASPRWRLSTPWWSRYPSNGLSGPSSI